MVFELWYNELGSLHNPFFSTFKADSHEEAFERWINFHDFSDIIGKTVVLIELKEVIENKNVMI